MKILFYSPHPTLYFDAPTGYGSHMRGMVTGFKEEGHIVEILVLGNKPQSTDSFTQTNSFKSILKKVLPKILWRTLKEIQQIRFDKHAAQELLLALQKFNPDIVYERSAWMSNGSVQVLEQFNLKHVVEINAPFEEEVKEFEQASSFISFIGKNKLKNLLQSANLVAPITSSLQKHIVKYSGVNLEKCLVVPNAIAKSEIEITESRVQEIRKTLDLTDKIVVGFVGSIFPYHGVDRLIHAVSKLNKTDVVLLIVGDGYLIPELKEQSRTLGLHSRVHFTGSVPKEDVYNHIAAMDVVTLPNTEWYCSPVKLFEYGALEKVVLAVNEAGVSDVMTDTDGMLFENNEGDFQEALNFTISNLNQLKEKANIFQQKILSNHTWSANARQILNQLNALK
ncbi:MAG: glycosyltransferase family 4 protein [Flavobacteriales bacterium]|nr:glycosyltransferase family 4 protein [Flavobacteriales bacterium]MDP4730669.1 glycosyltransferase family 4 protein [Flavobacteriales bacterium]